MNCRQCQNLIEAYIAGKLAGDELDEFVDHVHVCESCLEELKINYSIITALEQIDRDDELSDDYDSEVEQKISSYLHRRKRRKIVLVASFVAVLLISFVLGMLSSVFFVKNYDGISFAEDKNKEKIAITYNGVPEAFDPVSQSISEYNYDIIKYLHSEVGNDGK